MLATMGCFDCKMYYHIIYLSFFFKHTYHLFIIRLFGQLLKDGKVPATSKFEIGSYMYALCNVCEHECILVVCWETIASSLSLSLSLFIFEMSINLRLYYSRDCRKISRLPFSISWLEVCRRAQWLSSHLQGTQRSDELEGASVPWSLLNLYKHETLLKFHHGMLFRQKKEEYHPNIRLYASQ